MSAIDTTPHVPEFGFATRAIHHGFDAADYSNAVQPPVFFTSTYGFESVEANEAAAAIGGRLYGRDFNPTTDLLERRLAHLEGAEAGLVVSSGMAAFGTLILSLLSQMREIEPETDYEPLFDEVRAVVDKIGRAHADHQLRRWALSARIIDTLVDGEVRFVAGEMPTGRLPQRDTSSDINTWTPDRAVLVELVLRTVSARARRWYIASQRLVPMPTDWMNAIKVSSAAERFNTALQIHRAGGWLDLVLTVDEWCSEAGSPVTWGQIKQKTVSLRMYPNGRLNDRQADIVEHAESVLSEYTCEWCAGHLRHTEHGWLYASCDEHVQS